MNSTSTWPIAFCLAVSLVACGEKVTKHGNEGPMQLTTDRYWMWQVRGGPSPLKTEDREGKRLVAGYDGGRGGWIYLSEVERMPDKARSIVREIRRELAYPSIEGTSEALDRQLKRLARWTGEEFASFDEALAWDKKNGDFLIWSQADDQLRIDLDRQQRREAIAVEGIRVSLRGVDTWEIDSPYVAYIRIENIGDQDRDIRTNKPMVRLEVNSFGVLGHDGSFRREDRSRKSNTVLKPGEQIEIIQNLDGLIGVGPGPHTIVASVSSSWDGNWKGTATSLRHFVEFTAVLEADDPQ